MQPRSLEWKEKEKLFIVTWQCGRITSFPMAFLRKNCPCATCKDASKENKPKDPFKLLPSDPKDPDQAMRIDPVGRYAIRISWADGHATGLYSFDVLKDLSHKLDKNHAH